MKNLLHGWLLPAAYFARAWGRGLRNGALPLLLAIGLLLAACAPVRETPVPSEGSSSGAAVSQPERVELPERESAPAAVDFSALRIVRPDMDAFQANADALLASVGKADDQTVLLAYDSLRREYDHLMTETALAQIASTRDVTDETAAGDFAWLSAELVKAGNWLIEATEKILSSRTADSAGLTWGEEYVRRFETAKRLNSPATESLAQQEQELTARYQKLATQGTVTVNGEQRARAEVGAKEYARLRAGELGELLSELIRTRNQISGTLGFASYAEYAYLGFSRDYTPAEAAGFSAEVKETLAPLYQRLAKEFSASPLNGCPLTPEDALPALEKALPGLPAEMGQSLAFMKKHGLYDFSDSETKMNSTFTIYLPDLRYAYLLMKPAGQYRDVSSVFHEFGHFNNYFYHGGGGFNTDFSFDLAEVHSQGLEALLFPAYDGLFGTDAALARKAKLRDMLYVLLAGCMEDEFQRAAYALDAPAPEQLNGIYARLQREYLGNEKTSAAYGWAEIPHTFTSPFYYVSYAVSLVGALEIWRTAQLGGPASASALYERLSDYGTNARFRTVLAECGMADPFEEGSLSGLTADLDSFFHNTAKTDE